MIRPIHAVTVKLAGFNSLDPDVPHVTGVIASWVEIYNPAGLCILGMIKEFQLDASRMTAEEGEVDSSFRFKWPPG
jgi:hypothetical protein